MAKQRVAFQIGDIFYTSWGYDQRNVDFFEVVRTTAKTVWLQPINKDSTSTNSSMRGHAVPIPLDLDNYIISDHADELVMKRINPRFSDMLVGKNSWDYYYKYGNEPIYESSYS